jgi:hypothetical protein
LARLPHGNAAYIKEQLFSRFSIERRALPKTAADAFLIAQSTLCRGEPYE